MSDRVMLAIRENTLISSILLLCLYLSSGRSDHTCDRLEILT